MRTGLSAVFVLLTSVAFGAEPFRKAPLVKGYATTRVSERLGRGVVAMPMGADKVYLSWRLLATDPADIAFDVYRASKDGTHEKLNARPIAGTTDFVVTGAGPDRAARYVVQEHRRGPKAPPAGDSASARAAATPRPYLSLKLDGDHTFQKVGVADLDGDGRYDFVIKQPNANIDPWYRYWKKSPETYKLEAYRSDGRLLWRYDLGWAIERGIWYSPYVVYDFDGDGKAEVAVKTGPGDPRDKEGKVQSGPEHLTILDGLTGKPVARADWPSRKLFTGKHAYNYASRNQIGVAYLDGRTPCIIVERGTYNVIEVVAYAFGARKLRELWRWNNRGKDRRYWGQGAHWMHAADVDGDGRDEVVLGSAVLDDTGRVLWSTGLGHPDHAFVGDLDPSRAGLEIYFGLETRQKERNGMCMVDAKTGKILWGHQGYTRHVHSRGMCSDIDARHPGAECYSADTDAQKKPAWARLRTCKGRVIGKDMSWGFGPLVVYWDADAQRETLHRGRIEKYGAGRLNPRIEGRVIAVADVLGDWREELIVSVKGEMRIYTTTIPAADRRPCLMTDPIYRIDVAHAAMGYTQVPMLSYDLASRRR